MESKENKRIASDSYSSGRYILIALAVLSIGLAIAWIGFLLSSIMR